MRLTTALLVLDILVILAVVALGRVTYEAKSECEAATARP